MDLVEALRKKIIVLDEGEYSPGLKAVLLHIETAFRHLSRGQNDDDDTAFTDTIYRTNQAFEGSIKEAYRVLAGQDPSKKRPFDIENYLETNSIFRSRILSQLTTYRTEWRNPSAHDYKLDFDESEAFLAIISVSAFACLLLDQIAERLAYTKTLAVAESQKTVLEANLAPTKHANLLLRATGLLKEFCALHFASASTPSGKRTESQVIGALHGFLSSAAPELEVHTDRLLDKDKPFRADLLLTRGSEHLIIELKRHSKHQSFQAAVEQVENYMHIGSISNGIILFLPDDESEMKTQEMTVTRLNGQLVVLSPISAFLTHDSDI